MPEGAPSSVADGQVFHDELVTWLEFDQRAARERGHRGTAERGGMIRWLERDVHVRLQPHRRSAARAAGALRLGRWRWLFPLVVALLLAWLLSAWLQPPWSGLVGGRPQAAAGAAAVDVEARTAAAGGDSELAEPSSEEGARGEDEPALAAPTPSDGGDPTEPDDPEETPPLVDAPDDQRFVLPDFIGDGPTRRERMHVAELEQPRPGGAPRRQERSAAGGAGESRPRAAAVDFERAAERAVRSRHVPDAERGIVRRFFDELKKRGKR